MPSVPEVCSCFIKQLSFSTHSCVLGVQTPLLLLPYSKDPIELEAIMLFGLGRELVLDHGTLSNYKTAVTHHKLSISRSKKF